MTRLWANTQGTSGDEVRSESVRKSTTVRISKSLNALQNASAEFTSGPPRYSFAQAEDRPLFNGTPPRSRALVT